MLDFANAFLGLSRGWLLHSFQLTAFSHSSVWFPLPRDAGDLGGPRCIGAWGSAFVNGRSEIVVALELDFLIFWLHHFGDAAGVLANSIGQIPTLVGVLRRWIMVLGLRRNFPKCANKS